MIIANFVLSSKNLSWESIIILFQQPTSINSIMNRPRSALTLAKRVEIQRPKSSYRRQQIIFPQKKFDTPGGSYFATQADFEDFSRVKFSKAIQRFKNKAYSTTRGLFYNVDLNPNQSDIASILSISKRRSTNKNKKEDAMKMGQILKPCHKINKRSIKSLKNSLQQIRKETSCIEDFVRIHTKNCKKNKQQQKIAQHHRFRNKYKHFRETSNAGNSSVGIMMSGDTIQSNKQNIGFSIKGNRYVDDKNKSSNIPL